MKLPRLFILLCGIALCAAGCSDGADASSKGGMTFSELQGSSRTNSSSVPAEPSSVAPSLSVSEYQQLLQTESVNGIAVEMSEADVIAALGEPTERCEPRKTMEGTVQEYRFGSRTNYVLFVRDDHGNLFVQDYAFTTFTTKSGIQNGATRAEVIAAYGDKGLKPDTSTEEDVTLDTAEILILGEWRIGSMQFRFSEDKLTKIIVNAGAVG